MRFVFLVTFAILTVIPATARETVVGPITAHVVKVRDGDSIDVIAHVWPGTDVRVAIRLRGIDAPELRSRCDRELAMALAAKARLVELVGIGPILLSNISGGKYYGRVLATVHTTDGLNIPKVLLTEKLVRPYRGRRRASWCDSGS